MASRDGSETGSKNRRLSDETVEIAISRLLQVGVLLSAAVVALGAAIYLVRHGGQRPDFAVFRGEPAHYRYASGIVRWAGMMHGRGMIQLGVLMLIATPFARVALSAVAFAVQRDWRYVTITLVVLALLAASLSGLV